MVQRARSLAREAAVKALYQLDLRADLSVEDLLRFLEEETSSPDGLAFSRRLVFGIREHRVAIDLEIETVTINWELHRMAVVDRNILRLGAYELLFLRHEIPPAVAIDEAVTIAKKYSSRESGGFVNGILDKVYRRTTEREPGLDSAPQTGTDAPP